MIRSDIVDLWGLPISGLGVPDLVCVAAPKMRGHARSTQKKLSEFSIVYFSFRLLSCGVRASYHTTDACLVLGIAIIQQMHVFFLSTFEPLISDIFMKISHFQVTLCLCLKTSPCGNPLI